MRPLAVDLRSRLSPPRWAWLVLSLLMIVAVGFAAVGVNDMRELRALRAEHERLVQRATKPLPLPAPKAQLVMAYDASARAALAQAKAGWVPLLTSLETIQMVGVTPVSIDVAAAERQVRVELEFADFASLLRYVDELNAGESEPRWQLVQAQGATRQAATTAVPSNSAAATIRAGW